ncbi:phosphatidylinositol 4,5-bisphosphate 3-kinase catalytic subunit beta isoform-like [Lingula anatina]|uniref:Phosphatidylinositol 4,5-bisphosphate 3-kinase catalytic subunit beta isoform-like n=1 Tax=Lingula anatina TaxID=7574 RepID=A0A1S3I7U9_LINAN|nr:phosphatidylinositol 4,5-bisphosphate 3-kinase catalytic subunit beta isoform-like [Lingula anatina]|eukprot:XP_013393936.1 phosphatidylinositol 4,5-bisphosphate 3-kinase catalytic subunit beta isoform-like [Lingula anatina]
MGPYQLDYWSTENSNPCINVDCLLPTGLLVPLLVYKDATLEQIKQELWKEAQKLPLYGKLEGINEYLFMCINQTAEQDPFVDIVSEHTHTGSCMHPHIVLRIMHASSHSPQDHACILT